MWGDISHHITIACGWAILQTLNTRDLDGDNEILLHSIKQLINVWHDKRWNWIYHFCPDSPAGPPSLWISFQHRTAWLWAQTDRGFKYSTYDTRQQLLSYPEVFCCGWVINSRPWYELMKSWFKITLRIKVTLYPKTSSKDQSIWENTQDSMKAIVT